MPLFRRKAASTIILSSLPPDAKSGAISTVDLSLLQSVSYMAGALGVRIAAIFYVLNLRISKRNQELTLKNLQQTLETRQAQMFMNIYDQAKTNEFLTAYITVVIKNPWRNSEEYIEKSKDQEFQVANWKIQTYYEGLGVLVREGLLNIRRWQLSTGVTRLVWEKFAPIVEEARRSQGKRWLSETEYLYVELMKYLEKHPELENRIEKNIT
jgi:hypothetical protein